MNSAKLFRGSKKDYRSTLKGNNGNVSRRVFWNIWILEFYLWFGLGSNRVPSVWESNDLSIRPWRQGAGAGKKLAECLIWEYNQILPVLELVQVQNSAKNGQKIPYVKHLFDTLSEVHKGPVEPTKSFIQVHQTWTLPLWKKRGELHSYVDFCVHW